MGTFNNLPYRSMPEEGRWMGTFPALFLVLSAHFYQQADEVERAALTARRAAWEIEQRLHTEPWAGEQVPSLHELLADANACWNQDAVRGAYTTAISLFRHLDRTTPLGEEAEDFGRGGFHALQARYFPGGAPITEYLAIKQREATSASRCFSSAAPSAPPLPPIRPPNRFPLPPPQPASPHRVRSPWQSPAPPLAAGGDR